MSDRVIETERDQVLAHLATSLVAEIPGPARRDAHSQMIGFYERLYDQHRVPRPAWLALARRVDPVKEARSTGAAGEGGGELAGNDHPEEL